MGVLRHIMICQARSWGMRFCIRSRAWLDIAWRTVGRSISSLSQYRRKIWIMVKGVREVWESWFEHRVSLSHNMSYKRLINDCTFVWRVTWMLVSPALCFTCARVANFTPIQCGWYHWGPWAWMWGEPLPYRRSWWIPMMTKRKTPPCDLRYNHRCV